MKEQLKLRFETEKEVVDYGMFIHLLAGVEASWKGKPIIRHTVVVNLRRTSLVIKQSVIEKRTIELQHDLLVWYKNMVVDYNDLSYAQKKRVDSKPQAEHLSEDLAIVKQIRMRYDQGGPRNKDNPIVTKTVIVKLL